jgi:hypothetical protein
MARCATEHIAIAADLCGSVVGKRTDIWEDRDLHPLACERISGKVADMQSKTDVILSPSGVRKRLLSHESAPRAESGGEIDLGRYSVLGYSSEDPNHPIEHLIDGRDGTFWASARPNITERIVVEFDRPQSVSYMIYEAQEYRTERTQEVRIETSSDGGGRYRQILVQEYTFSPSGATFQHEEQRLNLPPITHLRLTVVPDKRGAGVASLSSLRLFS